MPNNPRDHRDPAALPKNNAVIRSLDAVITSDSDQVSDSSPDHLTQYSYQLWGPSLQARSDRFDAYKQAVDEARLDATWDEHLAKTITLAIIMGVTGAVLGALIGAVLSYLGVFTNLSLTVSLPPMLAAVFIPLVKNALGTLGLMAGTALLIAGLTGISLYIIPYTKRYERSRQINVLLPQTITYIYAHSQGGMHLVDIIDRLADEEPTYGAVAVEFQAIRNNMAYFGNDMTTALQEARSATPNEEFATLLDDFVSYVNTGGDLTSFLETKTHEFQRKARRREESILDSLDVIAEIYISAGVVLPLAAVIIFVIMISLGGGALSQLFATVYLAIPLIGVIFLIIHSGITTDRSQTATTLESPTTPPSPELINARLEDGASPRDALEPAATARTRRTAPGRPVHSRIDGHDNPLTAAERRGLAALRQSLIRERAVSAVKKPVTKLRDNPLFSLVFTIPLALLYMAGVTITGVAPLWPSSLMSTPVWTTTLGIVIPLLFILIPLSYLHERQFRYQRNVDTELPDILRKLATVNTSGANLVENIEMVAHSSTGVLADELERTHRHLRWNVSLNDALARFANRVENARVTRVTKLLMESNTTSGRVTDVLTVAAKAAQDQKDLDNERAAGMRQQIGIIALGYLVFLGVAIIVVTWLFPAFTNAGGQSSALSSGPGVLGFDFKTDIYMMAYYHACLIQATVGGVIAGEFGYNSALSGLKFTIIGIIIAALAFILFTPVGLTAL
jgi:flagellar protein FlaJ